MKAMLYRPLLAVMLALTMMVLPVRAATALEVRVGGVRVDAARVAATFELRDLLRDRFLSVIEEGRAVFLQLQAELWEDRRITDRMALTTPALTYRIARDANQGIVVTSQFGDRSPLADRRLPLPLRVDLGPASVLVNESRYYLRAEVTAATVADRDIDQFGTAIFGDEQSAAGLAGLGRFVFSTLLRIGQYLDSATAEATSSRYTGQQIRAGVS
jgi:hypothetical protein